MTYKLFKVPKSNAGDTIVEVLVSIAILGVVLATGYGLANRSLNTGHSAEQRTRALVSAQSQLEFIVAAQKSGTIANYKLDNPFCILTDGTVANDSPGETPSACDQYNDQPYELSVIFEKDTTNTTAGLFTVTAQWDPPTGSTQKDKVTLYYKLPGTYVGPGFAITPKDVNGDGTLETDTNGDGVVNAQDVVAAGGGIFPPPAPSPSPSGPLGSVQTFGSFEKADFSEYENSGQGGCDVTFGTTTVREGKYSATFNGSPNMCWTFGSDTNFRIHLIGFPPGTGVSMEPGSAPFWWAYSLYVPSNLTATFNAGPEIHQSNNADRCTQGPAPFNAANSRGVWQFVIRGGSSACPADNFTSSVFGSSTAFNCTPSTCQDWANGVSPIIQAGKWYDFLIGFKMAADSSGWFEAWVNGPDTNGKSVQIVPRANVPTSYPQLKKGNGEIQPNYPMDSLYYGNRSTGAQRTLIYDGGAMSNDFNALKSWQNSFTNSW